MSVALEEPVLSLQPLGESTQLPLEDLDPGPVQPGDRRRRDVKGLARSIKKVGLIHPLIVRSDPDHNGKYRIVAGRRRWRALKRLRYISGPCIVLGGDESEESAEVLRVVENHQREGLHPLEEAADVRKLLDLGLDPQAVAQSLGQTRSWVARRASLTELSERWRLEVYDTSSRISFWPPSHLEVVSRFPAEVQDRILDEWNLARQWNVPGLRDLVDLTGRYLHLLSAAPWKLDDDTLCAETGACAVCPKRSSHTPDLFAGELDAGNGKTASGDRCLDIACWQHKAELFLTNRAETLRHEHPKLVLLNNADEFDRNLPNVFHADVLNAHEVTASRKPDRRAVPALVVNGPGLGKMRWVKPVDNGRHHRAEQNSDDGEESDTPPTPKKPEEKRKPYDKRRRQMVIDAVKAKLEALASEDSAGAFAQLEGSAALREKGLTAKAIVLFSLLLNERGWHASVYDTSLTLPEMFSWEALSRLKNHELGTGEMRDELLALCRNLMRLLVASLATRLSVPNGAPDNSLHYAESEMLCDWLGFDLPAMQAEAAVAIPYAKLWQAEITDTWAAPATESERLATIG